MQTHAITFSDDLVGGRYTVTNEWIHQSREALDSIIARCVIMPDGIMGYDYLFLADEVNGPSFFRVNFKDQTSCVIVVTLDKHGEWRARPCASWVAELREWARQSTTLQDNLAEYVYTAERIIADQYNNDIRIRRIEYNESGRYEVQWFYFRADNDLDYWWSNQVRKHVERRGGPFERTTLYPVSLSHELAHTTGDLYIYRFAFAEYRVEEL